LRGDGVRGAEEPPMKGADPRFRDLTFFIRVLTVVIVALLVGIALLITGRTEHILVERFNEYHRTMVRLAAQEIEASFGDAGRLMIVLAGTLPPPGTDPQGARARLQRAVQALAEEGAVDLVHIDGAGHVVASASGEAEAVEESWGRVAAQCRPTPGDPAEVCAVPVVEPRDPRLPVRVMFLAASAGGAGPGGRLVLLFDWRSIAARLAQVTTINQHSAGWLLDGSGQLLWSVVHPDMVGHSALEPARSCLQCHAGFALERRMLAGGSGVGEMQVGGAPRKLVAWGAIDVFGHRWALAGSAPFDDVVASGRRNRTAVFVAKGFLVLVIVVLAILLDVQNRRRIRALRDSEEAAKGANEQLEAEVRRRADELRAVHAEMNDVRARFTALERLAIVGELASVVAHELRTPLNSLAIASQRVGRMLRVEPAPDVAKAREIVEAQGYEIRRIDKFIEDYLRLVRLPKPARKSEDINAIVRDVLRFMEVEEHRHGIRFLQDLDESLPRLDVDADQIRQVLLNLLVNAIQAMARGGEITVRTQGIEDELVLAVTDNGPGISAQDLPKIFEPFFTTKEKGTGLGLAICARLVHEHGGTIACDSEPGKGATFRIRLPLHAAEAGRSA
jgi:signal transduction histidine kinase